MGFTPHTVIFLARATRGLGALTLLAWMVDCGVVFYNSAGANSGEVFSQFLASIALFALPGSILMVCGKLVKNGSRAAAATIFIISILSLFKLVLLISAMIGPLFSGPIYFELPIRGLCALLSVACAYAWWDLADMTHNRSAAAQRASDARAALLKTFPPRTAPTQRLPRPGPKTDDPPPSQTPWF